MTVEKKGRGGSRPGAGRKPSSLDMIGVYVRVPKAAADKLKRLAKAADAPRWLIIAELILSAKENTHK